MTISDSSEPIIPMLPRALKLSEKYNSEYISIFIPTRDRPEFLRNLLRSIEETTLRKDLVDVWVYADHDDAKTRSFIESLSPAPYGFPVHFLIGPPPANQGELANTLFANCNSPAGLFLFCNDKGFLLDPGWDSEVREAYRRYPDRVLFSFLMDPYHGPHFGGFFILSLEWIRAMGRVYTELFPYWFEDTWLNQVAVMVGRWHCLSSRITFQSQGGKGKTRRMQNHVFWTRLFEALIPVRALDAARLRRKIWPEGSEEYSQSCRREKEFVRTCIGRPHTDAFIDRQFGKFSPDRSSDSTPPDPGYLQMECRAIRMLLTSAIEFANVGQWEAARQAIRALALGDRSFPWPTLLGERSEGGNDRMREALSRRLAELPPAPPPETPLTSVVSFQAGVSGKTFSGTSPRAGLSRKYWKWLTKQYVKFTLLQLVSRYTRIVDGIYHPLPYVPDDFPFSRESISFFSRLWTEFRQLLKRCGSRRR